MSKLILVVEDDEPTRDIFASALGEHGYEVLLATQGAEGVHLARRHQPDLILMDLRMPVMDGVHAIQYLKSDPQTAGIPICAISAYEADGERTEDELSRSWDCFLTKPITPHELIAQIEDTIGPARPEPPMA